MPVQSVRGLRMSSGYHPLMSSYGSFDDIIPSVNDDDSFVRSLVDIHDDGTSMAVSYTHLTLPTILLV